MSRFGAALAGALLSVVLLAGTASAAAEPAAPLNTPVPDADAIRAQGDAAVASAATVDSAGARAYLAQNAGDQDALRARLADSSAQLSLVSDQIDSLQAEIVSTEGRIGDEQAQLRVLARAIYMEPSSPLLVLTSSVSAGEALTRLSDLMVTGVRAARTKHALQADESKASAERARLEASRKRQAALLEQLQGAFAELQRYADAVQTAQDRARAQAGQIPAASSETQARMQEVIRQAWAPLGPDAVSWAERIAFCESTYNPYSVNRSSGASGLFQFMPATWAGTPWASQSPFDPLANAQAAAWLYQKYGPRQWDCSYRV